jgi:ATP-dependent exoDNAse (exonuclease V) beta subunit
MEGEADLYTKGKAKEASILIDPIAANLLEACQDLQDLIRQNYAIYELSNLVIGELYSLGVLAEIERNLQEVKSESNRLPIGEFNKVISDKLKDQPAAFLYERLGDRYQHYFIDEFQDTSRLQWKNLTPLVNNAMAQGGSSMLVGDGKQAIYRWRGGEVEQFLDLNQDQDASNRVLINGKEQKLYDMQSVALANNWRSRRNIVEFNNQFFKELIHTTDKGKLKVQNSNHRMLFDESSQEVKGKAGGYVEIKHFFRDKTQADLYAEQQNQYCLSIIQDALNRGYRLSDIAILNRKKSNSSALSKFLIDNGISIVSPDSLSLGDSTEIGVLLAFLQIVLRPDDNEGRLDFLEWLYKRLEEESLAEHDFLKKWCNAEPDQLFTFLSKHLDGFSIRHFLSLSLIEKIYELCFMLGFNLQQDPFLQAFMDVVVDFEVNKALGEAEFLRYWESKASENTLALPDDLDAVRMMTIHKSKGLEFPIVILAYADWRAFSEQKSSAWIPLDEELFFGLPAAKVSLKELQDAPGLEFYQPIYQQNKENIVLDNLNLLYVALTRAVDELYILSCDGWEDNQRIQIYLKHYLQSQGQEGLDWSNGEKQQKEEDSDGAVEKRLKEYERARMREKLAVTMEAPKNWQSGESESTSWGKKVHSVLSRVQYGDDQKEVLENMLHQGNFRAEEEEKLEHFVKELVNHAELKTYFQKDKKVLNEAEILLPKGNTARPDRLVQDGAKYHIIDYKTGKPAEHHKIQLDGYADILHQMGFEVGDKVLVYLQEGLSIEKW